VIANVEKMLQNEKVTLSQPKMKQAVAQDFQMTDDIVVKPAPG